MGQKLGELLIEEGRLNAHQLQEALQVQRVSGGSLGPFCCGWASWTNPPSPRPWPGFTGFPALPVREVLSAPRKSSPCSPPISPGATGPSLSRSRETNSIWPCRIRRTPLPFTKLLFDRFHGGASMPRRKA